MTLNLRRALPPLSLVHTVVFDFDGVFTDNKVWVDQDGGESVRCDRGDGLAFDLVRSFVRRGRLNAAFMVLSREGNPVVAARARKLKLDCHQGVGNKLEYLQRHFADRFPGQPDPLSGVVYLGNDLNDLPIMRRVGYAVAPADAHIRVLVAASLVLERRGGEGCVRELVERLLGLDKLSSEEIDELVSDC